MRDILIAACLLMPTFEPGGPVCSVVNQVVECRCSECMTWDPVVGATSYEVLRTNPGGSTQIVGTLREQRGLDDDGNLVLIPPATTWCFAKDSSMPQEGQTYMYQVRTCKGNSCGAWTAVGVQYKASPYAIDQFRPPVKGN